MNSVAQELARPASQMSLDSISKLARRVHMFTALFLCPWMLMYALSTLVMTHREYVLSFYPSKTPALVTERELDYSRSFPATTAREQMAGQILRDLGLDGTHRLSGGRDGKPLVINRQHALTARRISFDSSTHKLVV